MCCIQTGSGSAVNHFNFSGAGCCVFFCTLRRCSQNRMNGKTCCSSGFCLNAALSALKFKMKRQNQPVFDEYISFLFLFIFISGVWKIFFNNVGRLSVFFPAADDQWCHSFCCYAMLQHDEVTKGVSTLQRGCTLIFHVFVWSLNMIIWLYTTGNLFQTPLRDLISSLFEA